MALTGDFRKLDQWVDSIGNLAGGSMRAKASAEMAALALGFINQEFATSSDPHGRPWKPKKVPDGRPVGHGKTGKLKAYRLKAASSYGFTVYNPTAPHRKFFHGGTRRMAARPISPGTNLPIKWSRGFAEIFYRRCRSELHLSF